MAFPLLKQRLTNIISIGEPVLMVLKLLLLAFAVLNGVGVAYMVSLVARQQSPAFAGNLLTGINLFCLLLAVAKDFFPAIRIGTLSIPRYYPVNFIMRIKLFFCMEMLGFYFLYFSVFYVTFSISAPAFSLYAVTGLIWLLAGAALSGAFRLYLLLQREKAGYFLLLSLIAAAQIFACRFALEGSGLTIVLLSSMVAALAIFCLVIALQRQRLATNLGEVFPVASGINQGRSGFWQLFRIHARAAGLPLLVGFLLKGVMLFSFTVIFLKKGVIMFDSMFLYKVSISPLIIYTYLYNNLWGYLYRLSNSMLLHNSGFKRMGRVYFSMIWIPLAIDFTLSASSRYAMTGRLDTPFLLFYFSVAILFAGIGFLSAIMLPIKISKVFSLSTHVYASPYITVLGLGLTLAMPMQDRSYWWLLAASAILSLVFLYIGRRNFKRCRYTLLAKLA